VPPEQVAVVVVIAKETEEERIMREEMAERMRIGSIKNTLWSKRGHKKRGYITDENQTMSSILIHCFEI
jgi:hypothetical protein